MADIRVPAPMLAAGAAAFVVAVAAAAFFAGRSSSAPAPVAFTHLADPRVADATAPASTAPGSAPATTVPATTTATATAATATPASTTATTPATAPATTPATTPASTTATTADAQERAQVAKYFEDLDKATRGHGVDGDPQKAAMGILAQDPSGGGVRDLQKQQEAARDAVAAVYAPTPCSAHKSKTLDVMDEGNHILDDLARAMKNSDQSALASIAKRSQTVEDKSKAVDALAAQIRARYSL